MRERPILFQSAMVRALQAGTKTQTRRMVKPQPSGGDTIHQHALFGWVVGQLRDSENAYRPLTCPYGIPGDQLWVRETWAPEQYDAGSTSISEVDASLCRPAYCADFKGQPTYKWKPSIHMPRAASRIQLEVTGVRIERLQAIRGADCIAEGIEREDDGWKAYDGTPGQMYLSEVDSYRSLWDSINSKTSGAAWADSPWVWSVSFRRIKP